MHVELGKAQFGEKYPKGQATMSIPLAEDPVFLGRETRPEKKYGVHTLYVGNKERFFVDSYTYDKSYGPLITKNDYEETFEHHEVPLTRTYEKPTTLWVAKRKQLVTIEKSIDDRYIPEIRLSLSRSERPIEPAVAVNTGIEMIEFLADGHGIDPYDVTYLAGGTRNRVKPDFIGALMAKGDDIQVSMDTIPEGGLQKVIRTTVVYPK